MNPLSKSKKVKDIEKAKSKKQDLSWTQWPQPQILRYQKLKSPKKNKKQDPQKKMAIEADYKELKQAVDCRESQGKQPLAEKEREFKPIWAEGSEKDKRTENSNLTGGADNQTQWVKPERSERVRA